jgi:hypothetical protein
MTEPTEIPAAPADGLDPSERKPLGNEAGSGDRDGGPETGDGTLASPPTRDEVVRRRNSLRLLKGKDEQVGRATAYAMSLGRAGFGLDVCGRAKEVFAEGARKEQILSRTAFQRAYDQGLRERARLRKDQEAAEKAEKAEIRDQARYDLSWARNLDLPEGYQIPAGYDVDPGGVVYQPPEGFPARVASGVLVITRFFVDPDGAQNVELAWMSGGRWIRRTSPLSLIKDGRKLVQAHGDAGIPIVASAARHVEAWLAALESLNAQVIPREILARRGAGTRRALPSVLLPAAEDPGCERAGVRVRPGHHRGALPLRRGHYADRSPVTLRNRLRVFIAVRAASACASPSMRALSQNVP